MPSSRSSLVVLVLAAGQGKRLRSKKSKLIHPVAGRPMVAYVLDAANALRPDRLVTVVGHQADLVREALGGQPTRFVLQREQRGTGNAVLTAARAIGQDDRSTLLVLDGDLPALKPATLRRFVARHRRSGASLSMLTAEPTNPAGRDGDCGIYCAAPGVLIKSLRRLARKSVGGDQPLSDAVGDLVERGEKVATVTHHDADEIMGVDTRQELSYATRTLYARKAEDLQTAGVTVLDADRTWIDPRAKIGRDTVIYPDVLIEGPCTLGEDCVVGPGNHLTNMKVGRGAQIFDHCVMIDSSIGDGALVGPFARLRPGSVLETGSRVGNFVELKKTRLGPGSKANHLAYLGDSTIGPACNIGAGTITCNYDGANKYPTIMGRGVFIGSDTQIVAPVTLGDGAYVGAGATITKDVPAGALALSRQPQKNIEGWVTRRAKKSKKSKKK